MSTTGVPSYELGNAVRLQKTFTNMAGAQTDPTGLTLEVKKPDGTVDTFAIGALTHVGQGTYLYDYTPAAAGHYLTRWTATGAVVAAVAEAFDVTDTFSGPLPIYPTRQRVLMGAAATLRVTLLNSDGNPADASGAVTVAVTGADGTVVLAAGTATVHGTTGSYSVALTAAQTSRLDELTAVWTDAGDASSTRTVHEVVGGFHFSLPEARASNDGLLADTTVYDDARLLAGRLEVETEVEEICDVAFVPRYCREVLDGNGSTQLDLSHALIRTIRSVRVYAATGSTRSTLFTAAQLAALSIDVDGTLTLTDGNIWQDGRRTIVVEYEHGYDQPPADLKEAELVRLRSVLNRSKTAVNDRATSFTGENGQTYQLDTADTYKTGLPDVDAAYSRYSRRKQDGGKSRPISLSLNYDPQRNAVFHGGIR